MPLIEIRGAFWIALFLAFGLITGCATHHPVDFQPVDKIDGLASISTVSDGVQIELARAFFFFNTGSSKTAQMKKVLKPGEKISLGDGYHIAINLKFIGSEGDRYKFAIDSIHRPPNGPSEEKIRHVMVPAYGE